MTLAPVRATRRRPGPPAPDSIAALLRELLDGQRRILAALERAYGPRDAADQAVLLAVGETIGDRRWTCGQLLEHSAVSPVLHDALLAADVDSPRDLGWFCRRVHGSPGKGIRLERAGESRAGALWCVRVNEAHDRAL